VGVAWILETVDQLLDMAPNSKVEMGRERLS
jgi:hypothetical protein